MWKKLISWNILLVMKYSFGMSCNKQTSIHSKTVVNKSLLLPDCQKSYTTQIDMEKSINVSEGWVSGRLGLVWISISDICKPLGVYKNKLSWEISCTSGWVGNVMTAGFTTALGHFRLCSWPEIGETKMPGKGRNHTTILRASRETPSQCAQCALTRTQNGTTAVWNICSSPSVQKQTEERKVEKRFPSLSWLHAECTNMQANPYCSTLGAQEKCKGKSCHKSIVHAHIAE